MKSFLKCHLNDDYCFLCGTPLTDNTKSTEHVIPGWLQKTYDLYNNGLGLLNNTSIPYRQMVIPCCKTCNNGPLSVMERDVSKLLSGEFHRATPHEEFLLFQWCSKILYGLLHREMLLLADRMNDSTIPIVQRAFLERLTTFHHFMTSIRRPFNFIDFVPYSLFTVETLTFDNPGENFDYFDFIVQGREEDLSVVLVFAIRVGHFGVICVPNDNGFQQKHFQDQYDRFQGIPLHPIQFIELACKTAYRHSLLSFTPRYCSTSSGSSDSVVTVIQTSFPTGNIWNNWDHHDYADLFRSIMARYGFIVPPDQFHKQWTCLYDEYGAPKRIAKGD